MDETVLFSDFIKRFADFNQKMSVDLKNKDDATIPANRQVIISLNKAMCR